MTQRGGGFVLRSVLAGAAAASVAAFAVWIGGGIELRIGGALIRSHSALPALSAAAVCLVTAIGFGRAALVDALTWWWSAIERRAAAAAVVLAILVIAAALRWGTYVAGGSDSYCYLNQAELFARGRVHDVEPLAIDPAWPGTPGAFVPAGHIAVPGKPGEFAPICPAGYPVLLAVARLAGGRPAMFWVTPILAGAVVWLTFVLGRRAGGPAAGLLSAVLMSASPAFLFQAMQIMNDVPVTAAWCAALVAASRRGGTAVSRASWSGVFVSAAVAIRPNLVPLALVVAAWIAASTVPFTLRAAAVALLSFASAILPGVLFVLFVQKAVYGSLLRSGYGDLSGLFSVANISKNVARYPVWLVQVHTPAILAGLAAPFVAWDRGSRMYTWWLILFAAAVFGCYLPYAVFDDWWYLRFVLPAIPPLIALTSFVICRAIDRMPSSYRPAAFFILASALAVTMIHIAERRGTFESRDFEWRYRAAGEYIAARLPPNAAFITGHQTGSIRFYAGSSTAGWGDIEPGRLDEAVAFLRRHGREPYLLFEAWEEPHFRSRFRNDRLGELGWPATSEINQTVRIYDPDDYERYRRGERIDTHRVILNRD